MVLIADSGSTKTDWRLITDDNTIHKAKTAGINPYYQTADEIYKLNENLLSQLPQSAINNAKSNYRLPITDYRLLITKIFFYGAGCSNQQKCKIVHSALIKIFPKAFIEVEHDLLAAARVLCGNKEGIACILGTGSNSCYFNGEKIIKNIPSLGLLLGDEGSGSYLGKKLIYDFLNNEMPENIHKKFIKWYNTKYEVRSTKEERQNPKSEVLENIYATTQPHVYLASFSKFLFHYMKEPYIFKLIYDSFLVFFDKNVCKYSKYTDIMVHFVGSVAFYYNSILKQVAADKGVTIGNIIETPIAGLTLFHQK